jgi:hypothetical protein
LKDRTKSNPITHVGRLDGLIGGVFSVNKWPMLSSKQDDNGGKGDDEEDGDDF